MEGSQQFSHLDIFAEQFPDDVSVSALCDCGRHRRMHNAAAHQHPTDRHVPVGESDYQATYKAQLSSRPRSSKRPPPTPRNPYPAPMTFDTNQRTEFKNRGYVERVKPIKHEEHYEPPQVPVESKTNYKQEFTFKQPQPEVLVRAGAKETLRASAFPLDGRTTNKEAYKAWVRQPAIAFGELPSFTDSILFPEKTPLPESTMRYSYQGKFVPPIPLIKSGTPNIKLEGSHVFDTTHSDTYKFIKGDHRARPMVAKDAAPTIGRGKFRGETQSMHDFPGYRGRQPLPPRPAEPAPATIDLRFDNKRSFSTEQRTTFRGHDVMAHPVRKSCKVEGEEYQPPTVKFETETSQKRDYKPIDIKSAVVSKAIMPHSTMAGAGEATFDGQTMNMEFFKNWETKPRVRYGDFHENMPYLPPMNPFEGESITKSSFKEKKLEAIVMHKPAERPNSKAGAKVDYTTSYSGEYQKKQARMCRAQMYLLQQEYKRRLREKNVSSAPAVSTKPIAVK